MINRIFIIIVSFLTIFISQSQAWASSTNFKELSNTNIISVDKPLLFTEDESPSTLARRDTRISNEDQSANWLASIFVAGLGQIMMGDTWRGVKYMILSYGVAAVTGITTAIIGAMAITSVVVTFLIIAGVFYVLNIFDAYDMSREVSGISKLDNEKFAKLEKDLEVVFEISRAIKTYDNGSISLKALAF